MRTAAGPPDRFFDGDAGLGRTDALVVVREGATVVERYGSGVTAVSRLRSWSMAKSVLHAAVGILVDRGALDLDAPAPVDAWSDPDDPRHAITLRQLMTMRSGLSWTEEPDGGALPDVVTMLFGNDRRPQPDTAGWAAARPLAEPPGRTMRYSSGSSTIVSAIVRDAVGGPATYERWLRSELLDPIGMTSARLRFDDAGTWLASSYCSCTAADFARFGQLYLDGGTVGTRRVLPRSWVQTAAIETGRDALGRVHTMHWWSFDDTHGWGAYFASGYLGQYIVVVPPLDLVVVRLGETPTERRSEVHDALTELIDSFDR